jgi:serine/threonine protein kinase
MTHDCLSHQERRLEKERIEREAAIQELKRAMESAKETRSLDGLAKPIKRCLKAVDVDAAFIESAEALTNELIEEKRARELAEKLERERVEREAAAEELSNAIPRQPALKTALTQSGGVSRLPTSSELEQRLERLTTERLRQIRNVAGPSAGPSAGLSSDSTSAHGSGQPTGSARARAASFPMQHRRFWWFHDLFGFDESSTWGENVSHFQMDGDTLECRTAPQQFRRQFVGRFECPSVAELRSKLAAAQGAAAPSAGLSFAHLAAPAGVGPLHFEPSNAGAVFQAASQFNCLEMTGPDVSPSAGVGIYINDRTQGPACALACPAATVYRNYLVQHEGNTGQHPVQIDTLKEVGVAVGNDDGRYWVMQNGYTMPVGRDSLTELAARLRTEPNLVEQAEAALRVGVHWETSVAPPLEHRVCQVYASALPCAYARGPPEGDWEPFARLVLRAAYEATLAVGAVRSLEAGGARVKCYLTALGGGVFGNRYEWIRDAISHALDRYQGWPLDVVLVHYGSRVDANWAQDLVPREPALTQSGGASRVVATPHASMPYTAPALGSAVGDFLRGSSSSTLEPRRSSSTGSSHPSELNSRRKESCCVPTRQSSLPTPSELEQRFARLTNDSTSAHSSVPTSLRLCGELKHMTACLGTYLLAPQRTAHGKPLWKHATEDRWIAWATVGKWAVQPGANVGVDAICYMLLQDQTTSLPHQSNAVWEEYDGTAKQWVKAPACKIENTSTSEKEAEQREAERREAERREAERREAAARQQRQAADKAVAEKRAAEERAAEKVAAEKVAVAKAAADKAAAEKAAAERAAAERAAAEKRAADKAAADIAAVAVAKKAAEEAAAEKAAAKSKDGHALKEKADFAGARDAFDEAYRRCPPDGEFAQQSAMCLFSAGTMAFKANDLSGAKARYDELLGLKSLDATLRDVVLEKAAAVAEATEKAAAEKAAAEKAASEKVAAELKHWNAESDKLANARALLIKEQGRVRLAAAAAVDEDESLRDATQARNAARVALVHALDDALRVHDERHAEEERRSLSMEAAALQQQQGARKLTLAEQLRLECLHSQVLPVLDEWVAQIGRVREEREDLGRHAERPSTDELRALHEAWIAATDDLDAKELEEKKTAKRRASAPDAADAAIKATRQARRDVQSAQRALHRERTTLAQVAAAHFPELFAMEPLLKLGTSEGVDSKELQRVLVDRQLSHYDNRERISSTDGRHEVIKASYIGEGGQAELCVLKEYKLGEASEWQALLKEVKLLNQFSQCMYIATVDAVFVVHEPSYAAYVQLPYYNGGDMLQWLTKTAPEVWRRKALLWQLCEALRHVHSHGLAHGDVKLENTLVSLEGERATAHLADFESARRQQSSLSTSTGGSNAFTELYAAPEILKASKEGRERDAKPTAMGDMFSYGVCCLFACCLPADASAQQQAVRRFAAEDGRQLAQWSRDAATLADEHLPSLLDSLLAVATTNEEALARRLSASQTLRHAFLDTAAALEVSARAQQAAAEASMQAQQALAAASHEAAQQMAAVEREAARAHREVAWREAELRRRQAEQQEALERAAQQSELEAAAKRNEIQREQRRLEQERTKVRELEAAAEAKARAAAQLTSDAKAERAHADREAAQQQAQAQAMRKELEAEEKRVALECARRKAEAESAEAKATKERDELRIEREKARAMPDYWEKHIAAGSPDGFAAIALDHTGRDRSTWAALEQLLQTDPDKLKQSGADRRGTTHDRLKLAYAWRLENPALWEKYMSGVQGVMNDMKRIRQCRVASAGGAPPLTCRVADALPGDLRVDVNEALLMHGTNAGVLFNILSTGMNERYAGTAAGAAYGEGSYLAEDAGKNDQYTKVDPQYDGSSELHKRLYAHGARHQGMVFYILVCRVALGHQVRTQERGRLATSTDTGRRVFPISFRELDTVAGVSPPVHHHSLRAPDPTPSQVRYREFIVFHSEYIYPEYLLAYQRYEGGRGPMA